MPGTTHTVSHSVTEGNNGFVLSQVKLLDPKRRFNWQDLRPPCVNRLAHHCRLQNRRGLTACLHPQRTPCQNLCVQPCGKAGDPCGWSKPSNWRSLLDELCPPLAYPFEGFYSDEDDQAEGEADEQVPKAERGSGEGFVEEGDIDHSHLQGKSQ